MSIIHDRPHPFNRISLVPMPDPTTQVSNRWLGYRAVSHVGHMARLIHATEFRHAKSAGPTLKALDVTRPFLLLGLGSGEETWTFW